MGENNNQQTNKGLIGDAISALKEPGELTKAVISPAAEVIGQALGDLAYSSTLFTRKWRASSDFKLEKHIEHLQEKYKSEIVAEVAKIPEDKLIEPKLAIVGPAIEAAKYYIEESEVRKMFAKLIAASANANYKDTTLPAFVEIIKQLSPFDVNNLLELYKIHIRGHSACKVSGTIRATTKPTSNLGSSWVENFIPFKDLTFLNHRNFGASIDNLTRLSLIKITSNYALTDNEFQNQLENHQIFKDVRKIHELRLNQVPGYDTPHLKIIKGVWDFTNFGRLFIKCCLEEAPQ